MRISCARGRDFTRFAHQVGGGTFLNHLYGHYKKAIFVKAVVLGAQLDAPAVAVTGLENPLGRNAARI